MTQALPKILMIEDNEDDYEATLRSLKKNHVMNPVHWCRSGQDALDYLLGDSSNKKAHEKPDLILLDLNMPGIDGRTVLKKLKADPETKSIPVVVLTTSKDPLDVDHCYEIGASTYIQKPVSFEGLTDAIRTMKDYWFGIAIFPNHDR